MLLMCPTLLALCLGWDQREKKRINMAVCVARVERQVHK